MGRRSINSTKAGKFMNPTDQARKEARRKELKKNKKQRQQVREAVIKQKDPKNIIAELDNLDKLEYDPNVPPPYSAKVLQDKRRKLKEQWTKIYHFYQKEDPKTAYEIKQQEVDYERRHQYLMQASESIKQAQKVKVDEIPLPDYEQPPVPIQSFDNIPFLIPPPPPPTLISDAMISITALPTRSILKTPKEPGPPPGPPPGSPPDLSEFECDDDEFELGLSANEPMPTDKSKKIRFNSEVQSKTIITQPPPPPPNFAYPPPPPPAYTIPTKPAYSSSQVKNAMQIQQQASRVAQQIYQQSALQQQAQAHAQTYGHGSGQTTTIEAKPVLRNKLAEVTKFLPTSLIVRRDTHQSVLAANRKSAMQDELSNRPYDYMSQQQQKYSTLNPLSSSNNKAQALSNTTGSTKSTDAAYEDFMKEVSELI